MRRRRTKSHCKHVGFAALRHGAPKTLYGNTSTLEFPMTAANPASTPIARSKTAALSRVLDSVPKGYTNYTAGTCTTEKAAKLARKFHERYGIACSPAQRITRKKRGQANALLVMFWPSDLASEMESRSEAEPASEAPPGEMPDLSPASSPEQTSAVPRPPVGAQVNWLLLATGGSGPVHEQEKLRSVMEGPRLYWLGYELVRHSSRGRASWTWRRTKQEMADLYALLAEQQNRRQVTAVAETLLRIGRQPGFSGVREQSWALCQFARGRGYAGELPFLFHVQKVSHGIPMQVSTD